MLTSAMLAKGQPARRLGPALRFDPLVEAVYEAESGHERVHAIRRAMIVGLLLYNTYNLTDLYLIPDVAYRAILLRVFFVTPISIALIILVGHVGAVARERITLFGCLNAFTIPLVFFLWSDAPMAAYTVNELPLVLVFANMLVPLRFRHAALATAAVMGLTLGALALKTSMSPDLAYALAVQVATCCALTLFANWQAERGRSLAFLQTLEARHLSSEADASRRRYEDLSLTDVLTGLPNRRALDLVLQRCLEGTRPFAVLMVDIDHFKLFNDCLGHPAGDDCLRSIAAEMRRTLDDPRVFLARFGGEEFTVIFEDAGEFEAVRCGESIVARIAALGIVHPGRTDGASVVTASVGIALASGQAERRASVLADADDALYAAKRHGRNGWHLASGPAGEPAETRLTK